MDRLNRAALALTAAAAMALAGCGPALVIGAAGAGAGYAVSQERGSNEQISDLGIETRLANRMAEQGDRFDFVNIDVSEGRVILTGAVDDPEDSVAAIELAWGVPGVTEVVNETEIAEGLDAERYADDVWISTQVRSRLLTAPGVAFQNFSVETFDRVVHLIGLARSPRELQNAADIASRVPGVREVRSHVLIVDDERRPLPTG